MFKRHRQGGFSLVELMVVVAIIGILATIAIPRVNKFIAKARQSEAQVNLSSFYTFNKNFYVEFQGYTNAFGSLGFLPEGNLRYNTGIGGGLQGPTSYTQMGRTYTGSTSSLVDCPSDGSNTRCRTISGANNAAPAAVAGTLDSTNFSSFTAQSRAQLIAPPSTEDLWSINQDKNLRNVTDGTM